MAISFDKRKTQIVCERLISDEQSKLPANTKLLLSGKTQKSIKILPEAP